MKLEVLFVCLGNICRSPTAEGIMRSLVAEAGLADVIGCDSAGTGSWQVGDLPDRRARAEAASRGLVLDHRAWQVRHAADLERFDLVLAMDRSNLADLRSLAPRAWEPDRIRLLRAFDPAADEPHPEVPDPWGGGPDGFAEVFDLCTVACRGLLDHLVARHGLTAER